MALGSLTYEVPGPRRWNTFIAGLAIDVAFLMLLVAVGSRLSTQVEPRPIASNYHVTLIAPVRIAPVSEPVTAPVPVPTIQAPAPVVAELETPKIPPTPAERVPTPQPPKAEIQKSQIPRPEVQKLEPLKTTAFAAPAAVAPAPARPSQEIKSNVLDPPKTETATVHQPAHAVQTGGFGDPSGIGGHGDPRRNTVTVASLGSFDLPSGPGTGNGTGGLRGVSGTIRTTGFGDSAASPTPRGRSAGSVMPSGFGDVIASGYPASPERAQRKPELQPVEIVYKPRPAYTPEARQLRLEGEVLLDVVFTASGSLHVNRVVKGLGHGLDDSALAAAQRIQFHPARRDGQPYDCAALVHMVFELAD
jgi:TonB family protein